MAVRADRRARAPQPEVIAPDDAAGPGCREPAGNGDRRAAFRQIPTLTVPATLVDIAGRLAVDDLARACHEAGVRYRTTPGQVDAVLRRRPHTQGRGDLRLVMSGDEKVALSRLESAFLALLRAEQLPLRSRAPPTSAP